MSIKMTRSEYKIKMDDAHERALTMPQDTAFERELRQENLVNLMMHDALVMSELKKDGAK